MLVNSCERTPASGVPDLRGFEWRYLWNLCHDESRISFTNFQGGVRFTWMPDPASIAIASGKTVKCLSINDATWKSDLISNAADTLSSLAFSPVATNLLATGAENGAVQLWDLNTRQPDALFAGLTSPISAIAFSPDGQYLAAATGDSKKIALWDVPHRTNLWFRETPVRSLVVVFSPDGRSLISGGGPDAGNALLWDLAGNFTPFPTEHKGLWDVKSRAAITDLLGPADAALDMCFSPNGSMLATGSADRTVHIWNPTTHALLMILTNDFRAGGLAFSRDGQILGVADAGFLPGGKCLCFWDLSSRQRLHRLAGYETDATTIAFAHRSDLVAIGYFDGTVRLWDFPRERLPSEFHQHSELIWSLTFNESDTLLASGGEDQTAVIYDVAARRAFPSLRDRSERSREISRGACRLG